MTMTMPVVHRLTGTALYFGTLLLTWWLIAAAEGQTSYQLFESWISSPAGKVILLCYTWELIRHLLGCAISSGISDRNLICPPPT